MGKAKGEKASDVNPFFKRMPLVDSADDDLTDLLPLLTEEKAKGVKSLARSKAGGDQKAEEDRVDDITISPAMAIDIEDEELQLQQLIENEAEAEAGSPGQTRAQELRSFCDQLVVTRSDEIQKFRADLGKPLRFMLAERASQMGKRLYTLDHETGSLIRRFPWFSTLPTVLTDVTALPGVQYFDVATLAAAEVDPHLPRVLEVMCRSPEPAIRRSVLFSSERTGSLATEGGCYAMSPDVESLAADTVGSQHIGPMPAQELRTYIGTSQNIAKRYTGHMRSDVNRRVREAGADTSKSSWRFDQWFASNDLPTSIRFWIEHLGIVAFGTTDREQGGLQINTLDNAVHGSLIGAAILRQIIAILDAIVDDTRLPVQSDEAAWRCILRPILPPESQISFSTLIRILKGVDRQQIWDSMDPRPTRWSAYLASPQEDLAGYRDGGATSTYRLDMPRPISEEYLAAQPVARNFSCFNEHNPDGQLERAAEIFRVEAVRRGWAGEW